MYLLQLIVPITQYFHINGICVKWERLKMPSIKKSKTDTTTETSSETTTETSSEEQTLLSKTKSKTYRCSEKT